MQISNQIEGKSLEEQLAILDAMLAEKQAESDADNRAKGLPLVPIDPADLTMCDGCQ
jgi:hypothetical protein